jgi:hypothetical protein
MGEGRKRPILIAWPQRAIGCMANATVATTNTSPAAITAAPVDQSEPMLSASAGPMT